MTSEQQETPAYRHLREPDEWYRGFARHLADAPQGKPLRTLFPVPKDADDALQRHRYILSRAVVNPPLEHAIADAVGRYGREVLGVPQALADAAAEQAGDRLADRGWTPLPAYGADRVRGLKVALEGLPLYAKDGTRDAPQVTREEARARYNIATYRAEDLLRLPEVVAFVTAPDALAAAERYLGAPPMLIVLQAWWSFAGHAAKEAQLFHLDIDDHRFCKQFLFLTDVDAESGPHAYVERTHRPQDVGAIIARGHGETEQKAIFDWLYQTLRKSDEDVARYTGKEPTLIDGPAGTRFLAATRGLHKGVAPERRDRLLLQATYGITPAAAKRAADLPASALAAGALDPPNDHLLWLFVDPTR